MSASSKRPPGVHRLLDIVVEEVSLVDRAANKHRFLIVKRSEDMSTSTEQTADVTAHTHAAEGQETSGPSSGGGQAQDGGAGTLEAAVSALEGLTEAVELLGTAGEADAEARVAELASELRQVADRLAGPPGGSADAPTGKDGEASAGDSKDKPGLEAVIGQVKDAIARVSALVSEARQNREGGKERTQPDDNGDDRLATLIDELRALTSTVKEQQQRLARLEKRFGVPSSVPAGEQTPASGDDEVGWPLDMNRSLDRESVDKAVSFHDV